MPFTYYFSTGGMHGLKKLHECGARADVLVSFAHMQAGTHKHCERVIAYKKQTGSRVMLDSGAFTNFQKPGTVTFERYLEFLQSNAKHFDEVITLDDLRSRKTTLDNFAKLKRAGYPVLLVDHLWDCSAQIPTEFVPHWKAEKKLCLAGWGTSVNINPGDNKLSRPRGVMTTLNSRVDSARKLSTTLHMLAVGSVAKFLPHLDRIDSVDSAVWTRAPGYGNFIVCRTKQLADATVPILQTFDGPENHSPRRPPPPEVTKLFRAFNARVHKQVGNASLRTIIELFCVAQIKHYVKQLGAIGAKTLMDAFARHKEAMAKSRAAFFLPITIDEGMLPDIWDAGLHVQKRQEDRAQSFADEYELDLSGDEVFIDDGCALVRIRCDKIADTSDQTQPSLSKQVPDQGASNEAKREAQKLRSREWEIEALEGKGERLAFPAGFPRDLRLYGDPVNLMYPLDPPARARNARARFKQFAEEGYESDQSKQIVHGRIVRRLLQLGARPSYDEDDPLDRLLPGDVKRDLRGQRKEEKRARDVRLLPIDKADEDKNIVFGIVLEPDTVDAQGDTIEADEIARAAHLWLARFQDRGLQHEKLVNSKAEIYESYLAPTSLTMGGQKVKKGTWLLMLHVLDKTLWSDIKEGKFTGFSMGGFARRVRT